jgi:hypothetical protein
MAAVVELRRGLPGDVEVGDENEGHRRLAPDLAKLSRCSLTAKRRRRDDLKAAAVLGFRVAAREARWRLGFQVRGRGGAAAA